jgi:hypothetical protein
MPHPAAGYQTKDGRKVPGTTTIIGRWKESGGLINWAYAQGLEGVPLYETRDNAGDVGTFVHLLIEHHINGNPLPPAPPTFTVEQAEQAMSAFEAFEEWERGSRLKMIRQEQSLVCEHHRFGGTYDAVAQVGESLAIVDWKSSKAVYFDYVIQLAAYKHLHEDHYPAEPISAIHIIRFGKSGCDFTHRYFRADHEMLKIAWRQFLLFREAFDIDKALKKGAS